MRTDTHAFIIRLWHEDVDEEGNIRVLRGTIEYVGYDEMEHFTNLKDAFLIIANRLGLSGSVADIFSENGR